MELRANRIVKQLFRRVSIERILSDRPDIKIYYDNIPIEYLQDLLLTYYAEYSDIEVRYQMVEFSQLSGKEALGTEKGHIDVFSVLKQYIPDILVFHENKVVCRYDRLLEWNHLVKEIGEDLPVISMIVEKDIQQGKKNDLFTWQPVIKHNNRQLDKVLQKGMADNHFHLRGSSHYFQLSWINLMNNLGEGGLVDRFNDIEKDFRDKNKKSESLITRYPLSMLVQNAALIRVYLFGRLEDELLHINGLKIPTKTIWDIVKEQFDFGECSQSLAGEWEGVGADGYLILSYLKEGVIKHPSWKNFYGFLFQLADVGIWREKTYFSLQGFVEDLLRVKPKMDLNDCIHLIPYDIFESLWAKAVWQKVNDYLSQKMDHNIVIGFIQSMIDNMRYRSDHVDYALSGNCRRFRKNEKEYLPLAGERWFIYSMLRSIYSRDGKFTRDEYNLFYAYLRIKNEVRGELVQTNDMMGFENFSVYQGRKDYFSHIGPHYVSEGRLARLAVRDVLCNPAIRFLEVRIKPEDSAESNIENIYGYDKAIIQEVENEDFVYKKLKNAYMYPFSLENLIGTDSDDLRKRFFYVFHFAKKQDEELDDYEVLECRHYKYRNRIMKISSEILKMRRNYPECGRRVLGIDACSQEIGCRPEVFAQIFRGLKNHVDTYIDPIEDFELPQLKATYHVGEDFLDITDGLRAIDEAIRFLNLDCGDRLGHALALGIDPVEWYASKNNRITLPLQDYLDNITWLHHKLIKYQISDVDTLIGWLEEQFSYYFNDLYRGYFEGHHADRDQNFHKTNFDVNTYYYSWLLRGDDPAMYKTGRFKEEDINSIDYWGWYAMNRIDAKENKKDIRYIPEVSYLYYMYHYDRDSRKRGLDMVSVHIHANLAKGVKEVQKALREEIAQKGISIETNPSSNMLIGYFKSYSQHPLSVFYNLGLTQNDELLYECPQINASINTDDKGVFNTRLENEYALMASAMENVYNGDGTKKYKREFVFNWLDNIRKNGLKQVFCEVDRYL